MDISRQQTTWIRQGRMGKPRITHPFMFFVIDHEGTERAFGTKAEAEAWIANYEAMEG